MFGGYVTNSTADLQSNVRTSSFFSHPHSVLVIIRQAFNAIIAFLDVIHSPAFYLKHKKRTMNNVQKLKNCINIQSSRTFRSGF
jgi:hypothetical protein